MKYAELIMLTMLVIGCACETEQPENKPVVRLNKEKKAELNHWLVRNDSAMIVYVSDSLGLDTIADSRGLWVTIHQDGEKNAKVVKETSTVTIAYNISDFVTGEKFYSSKKNGAKKIHMVQTDEPHGLIEALIGKREGVRATVVLLPDKAFGLVGDGEKITGRRIIRYDFEILKVE